MVKIIAIFGTRPEAIKMAPLINSLKTKFDIKVCVTAQHREMLDQVMDIFEIKPDYDLDIMGPDQDLFDITTKVLLGIKSILLIEKTNLVLVHGDTTTSMASSIAAFYLKIPVAHVEAGLRTHKITSPFPEEFNRQLTSKIANLHFAPTKIARQNLLDENISDSQIFITGNTVIDALFIVLKKARLKNFHNNLIKKMPFLKYKKNNLPKIILVTGHRRENFGSGFEGICKALNRIALDNPKVQIIYPVHLNPNVLDPVKRILSNVKNIHLIEPLDYLTFVKLMDLSYLILTDSGGIQEEAPSLGKPILLMRDLTERPESLESETVILVGSKSEKIIFMTNKLLNDAETYSKMSKAQNPYGNGDASKIICEIIEKRGVN